MYVLNIYRNTGLPRTDIPDDIIAKLSPEQYVAFFAVMSSFTDTTEMDAAFITAEKKKRAAITNLKKLMDAHEKITPPRSFYDEWKRTVAKIPDPEPDPEIAKKVAASLKTIDKANTHMDQCDLDLRDARKVRDEK